jgi:hypothetical protein
MGSGGEGVGPVRGGHRRLKKECADDVVGGAEDALSLSILLRGVGTRHAKRDTVSEEEGAGDRIVKLATIVTLDRFDVAPKLSTSICKEIRNSWKGVRFKTKWKGP